METIASIGINLLYLLALINPVSKIAVLSGLPALESGGAMRAIVRRSSLTAGLILLGAMFFGDFILRSVFHVELHSLRISGGVVLFWVGFNALRKGVFFEQDADSHATDLAVVPLACPMIAGPATIAASIALAGREGHVVSSIAVLLAVAVNAVLMSYAKPIAAVLQRLDILSALIRITGLIVMTIGTQMVTDGIAEWHHNVTPP
jgi:multiple antibiotic resistance protein